MQLPPDFRKSMPVGSVICLLNCYIFHYSCSAIGSGDIVIGNKGVSDWGHRGASRATAAIDPVRGVCHKNASTMKIKNLVFSLLSLTFLAFVLPRPPQTFYK